MSYLYMMCFWDIFIFFLVYIFNIEKYNTYAFSNLKKKDGKANPNRKMTNMPRNHFFSTENSLCILIWTEQFQINFMKQQPCGYLDSNIQEFTRPYHSAGLKNACLIHFPSAMWGTSLPYIQNCMQSNSCHFQWVRERNSYVMACIDSHINFCAISSYWLS
jgi:hypothetical protein